MLLELENDSFLVVHPLEDAAETKREISHLGPMKMTRSVRWSLIALRGYLLLMMLMLLYHVVDLASWWRST